MLQDERYSVAENDKEDEKCIGSDNSYFCHGA